MNWGTAVSWNVVIPSAAIIFSVISYVLSRRSELAWKRTEFLYKQAQQFDDDKDLLEVSTIIENRHPEVTVDEIFDDKSSLDPKKKLEYKLKFDRMFNFLWRLCYAYLEVGTLSRSEVVGFRWYFRKISESPRMVAYCNENGYEDINRAIRKLKLGQKSKNSHSR